MTTVLTDTRLPAATSAPGSSVVDVDRWTAEMCRDYLRYHGGIFTPHVPALVARVRERLASLQLTELWPVDGRD